MAAPMKCVKYLWTSKMNSGRLVLIQRDLLCRTCVNFNDKSYSPTNFECHFQIKKYFSFQHRPNSRLCNYEIHQSSLYEGHLKSLEKHSQTISNVLSNSHYRRFSVQENTKKDDSTQKKAKENIYTVPNLLTMSRVVLTPVIGYLVVQNNFTIALGLFAYAGLTDLLDGYIARNFKNQMSSLGTALDPLADKLMITVLTVTLTMSNLLPMPLATVIIGRDVLLILTGFVIRYVSLPPPKTFKRYFDVTFPTAELLPTKLSKWNTANQILLVMLTLAAPVYEYVDHPVLQGLWYLTAATTLGSGIDYIVNWKKCLRFIK